MATYASNVLGHRLVFTCSAENIKHMLSTAFADFDSSPLRKPMFEPITPHGIFTLDGADWKRSREQLRNRLSNLRKVIDLGLCEQHFQAFLRHVPPNGQVFDIQRCTPALALNMQTRFSLGESVDALDFTQSQEKKQFVDDLDVIKERIVRDGFRGPLRHLMPKQAFHRSCCRARKYVMACVRREVERRSSRIEKTKCGCAGNDFNKFEEISQFADQAMSILLANDSMSTTLSGLFYCLSRDERIVKKFRTSIVDAIGLTPPTWSQLRMLHYVRWVLQEVMRVFPAVVFNARVANKHSTMPSGGGADGQSPVLVRKGDIVVFSTWARHRLGKDLGESPEKFYPERWEHLNSDMPGFIPFNRGPRICAGRQYAMTVLTYIVARIFQTFSNVSNYNTKEWTERISMTFENENGVLVGLS
ncbi:unnamed protein product [Penicillium nalgiovense]|uniref:Cytochrome P450 n=1 Tax=Penicillium nalgiovense TaxID=60175 RepID=A0A9W4HGQ3_PENNA|nr:unnamed protein product [Penicillium nalgiovense]CAG7958630.1 unnamed protein product [Penicillium nalgiovense]CAG8007163.1 unnamed protein product [Penicillium nalgiovense]CAG8010648.1 unnamed protein product [Penicillium nalgiovense]CAG8054499.1 unnamed protein product [Penicillium nalgiovense]